MIRHNAPDRWPVTFIGGNFISAMNLSALISFINNVSKTANHLGLPNRFVYSIYIGDSILDGIGEIVFDRVNYTNGQVAYRSDKLDILIKI